MQHSAVSDLGLHCLFMSNKMDARLIWVNLFFARPGSFITFIFCRNKETHEINTFYSARGFRVVTLSINSNEQTQ